MNVSINVLGLKELRKALRSIDKEKAKELRRAFNEVGEIIVDEARTRVPVRSGALRDSIRAVSTQREGRVLMGYEARVPYAGWIDFGGTRGRPYVKGGRVLFPSFDDNTRAVERRLEKVLDRLVKQADLD